MYPIIFFTIAIISALLRIFLSKKTETKSQKTAVLLLYLIVMCIGVEGLYAFTGHAFMADFIAKQIGWPTGSPFQFEIAVANLSYGVMGILCIWFRGKFWMATVIGNCIFLWGAAYGHFVQMQKGDYSPYNTGIFLYVGDIIIPFIIFMLMVYYFITVKKESA